MPVFELLNATSISVIVALRTWARRYLPVVGIKISLSDGHVLDEENDSDREAEQMRRRSVRVMVIAT